MPKSRNRKNHKQKSQARSSKLKQDKARIQKIQRQFIMDLINKEKEKGLFENTPMINSLQTPTDTITNTETPSLGIEGPSI